MERTITGRMRIMLVEDHGFVRAAIRQALETEVDVVAEAGSAEEALQLAAQARPDIILLDLDLPGTSGLEVLRDLTRAAAGIHVVILSASTAPRDVLDAFRRGAVGYLGKDLTPDALRRALRGLARGELVLSRHLAGRLVPELVELTRRPADPEGVDGLTLREQDVLRLLAEGLTDREIARTLSISPRTVESHVSSILRRLGLRNRAEAARRYHQGR